jgi:dTDP-glucose 4,6-dehydratase
MHQPTNVLVTGGAGFIGSNFVHLIAPRVAKLVVLDALTYAGSQSNLAGLPSHVTFVEGNILDRALVDELMRVHEVDTVIHFAAESHVDRSIHGPEAFVETNVQGTLTLLEAAKGAWMVDGGFRPGVRFHHVSTDEVYGTLSPDDPAFTEETPYAPNSPYAASKAASDHLVRAYQHTYGFPATVSNCSNNYGPRQFPEKLIPLVIMNALKEKPLPIYGDGQQVRDWLYVDDHNEAIWTIVTQSEDRGVYNIGGDNQPTNLEIVHAICGVLDELMPRSVGAPYTDLITFVKDRPGHDRRYAMDIRKIKADLGWVPSRSLAVGLRDTITWYLENTAWLSSITGDTAFSAWIDQNYGERIEG